MNTYAPMDTLSGMPKNLLQLSAAEGAENTDLSTRTALANGVSPIVAWPPVEAARVVPSEHGRRRHGLVVAAVERAADDVADEEELLARRRDLERAAERVVQVGADARLLQGVPRDELRARSVALAHWLTKCDRAPAPANVPRYR